MSKRYGTVDDRFFSYVEFGPGCWIWHGPTSEGYGRFRAGNTKIRAHRYVFEREFGPIGKDWVVRHTCDNPLCVNPDHLEIGTHADNVRDMDDRGRRSRGSNRPDARLTDDQVQEIRSRAETHRALAEEFGVSHCIIGRIKRGEDWKHV